MRSGRHRVLFLSGFFPPYAPIGSVRTAKLAQHWVNQGQDVRVIAILHSGSDHDESPAPFAHYLPYREPGQSVTALRARMRSWAGDGPSQSAEADEGKRGGGTARKASAFVDLYRQIVLFPDRYKSWVGPAVELAASWLPEWRPQLLYSSGPPNASHIAAARLARVLRIPWIAELRDLWADNPYSDPHPLLAPFHNILAKRTLMRAAAHVVVTKSAAAQLRKLTGRAPLVSYNGYDPSDFEGLQEVDPLDRDRLTIIHAGTIYPGRRDPSPLFKAMKALGEESERIRCLFYHDENGSVASLARQHGVAHCVQILDRIPRSQILRVERQADILLECRWFDPAGDGVIPGKLFEYIGARRPILSLGSPTGEAAEIVRAARLGLASNDPSEIKAMLLEALKTKAELGRLPDIAPSADARFQRTEQFERIDALIDDILKPSGLSRPPSA